MPTPPPPPPGFTPDEIPSPEPAIEPVATPPPPAPEPEKPSEVHENDVLKRSAKFSWKNFGGDGFMVSVAVHLLLAIIGIFYVVSKYVEPPKKPDTEVFSTGAGGGQSGDKAKAFEHRLKTRNHQVKTPSRIVSKSSTASVSLPSTPSASTAAFASGLSSGGLSKGSGGGSGGGEGTGIGIGKGGGHNFVSLFGAKGLGAPGLPGTLYDLKQFADGTPTPMQKDVHAYEDFLRDFVKKWDTDKLQKYFRSDVPIVAERIFIPVINDTAAPAAFDVADKVKAGRWLVIYEGKITSPVSGKIRLWGVGDDTMVVNWNGKNVLDSGYFLTTVPAPGNGRGYTKPVLGSDDIIKKGYHFYAKVPFRSSTWLEVAKGRDYPVRIAIGEIYGGKSSYHLLWEQQAQGKNEGDGIMRMLNFSQEPPADSALSPVTHPVTKQAYASGGAEMEVQVDSPVWKAKGRAPTIRR